MHSVGKWALQSNRVHQTLDCPTFIKLISIIGLFKFGGHRSTTGHVQTQWLAPSSIHFLQIQEAGHLYENGKPQKRPQNKTKTSTTTTTATTTTEPPQHSDKIKNEENLENKVKNNVHPYTNGYNNNNNNAIAEQLDYLDSLPTVPICLPKKLQVTEKDGSFIALDNNSLKLMQKLERLGHCTEVEVEIVPLSKVPPNIVQEIVISHENNNDYQHQQRKIPNRCKCRTSAHFHHHPQFYNDNDNHNYHYHDPNFKKGLREITNNNRIVCKNNAYNKTKTMAESIEMKQIIKYSSLSSTSTSLNTTNMALDLGQNLSIKHQQATRQHVCQETATTSTSTTSFSLNGFNTYLSDQQLKSARMSNTMTVMAPCLRKPITTSTPVSDLTMRQFKWQYCCSEKSQQQHHDNQQTENSHCGQKQQRLTYLGRC